MLQMQEDDELAEALRESLITAAQQEDAENLKMALEASTKDTRALTRRSPRLQDALVYGRGAAAEENEAVPQQSTDLTAFRNFRTFQMTHACLGVVGPKKPVGTPHSGSGQFQKAIEAWQAVSPSQKQKFTTITGLNVRITRRDPPGINPFILYHEVGLKMLALASGLTEEEIFDIITSRSEKSRFEMDVINVAFDDPIRSESGAVLKQIYNDLMAEQAAKALAGGKLKRRRRKTRRRSRRSRK